MARKISITNKEEIKQYAIANYPAKTYREIGKHFNISAKSVQNITEDLGLSRPVAKVGERRVFNLDKGKHPTEMYKRSDGTWRVVSPQSQHTYTDEDKKYIKDNLGTMDNVDIAKHIGVTYAALVTKISVLRNSKFLPPKVFKGPPAKKERPTHYVKREKEPNPEKQKKEKRGYVIKSKALTPRKVLKTPVRQFKTITKDNSMKVVITGMVMGKPTQTFAMPGVEHKRVADLKMINAVFTYPTIKTQNKNKASGRINNQSALPI